MIIQCMKDGCMEFTSEEYCEEKALIWDDFVLNKSMNGTFLQTRRFINYHKPGKFKDASLLFYKGQDIVAVVLACKIEIDDRLYFFSHRGTTFGGLIIAKNIYSATAISELMDTFEDKVKSLGFSSCYMKQTATIFQKNNTDLIDYFFYQKGYKEYTELNYYMNLSNYKIDVVSQFSSGKRRDYRYSLKNNLQFTILEEPEKIGQFYEILLLNLKKLGLECVHSFEDLIDLKFHRFYDEIEFYGVYHNNEMIAGSMIFMFDQKIFHTQYLASNQEYLFMYPMDFLITNLIQTAVNKGMETFTFGICTEEQGKYINLGLSRFKEGFGADYSLNKSYEKKIL